MSLQRILQECEIRIISLTKVTNDHRYIFCRLRFRQECAAERQLRAKENSQWKQKLSDLETKYQVTFTVQHYVVAYKLQSLRESARNRILALQEVPPETEMSLLAENQRLQLQLKEQQADFRRRLSDQQRLRAQQQQQHREETAELRGRIAQLESMYVHSPASHSHGGYSPPQRQQQQQRRTPRTPSRSSTGSPTASTFVSSGAGPMSVPEARRVAESAGVAVPAVGYASTLRPVTTALSPPHTNEFPASAHAKSSVSFADFDVTPSEFSSSVTAAVTVQKLQRSLLALQAQCARKDAEIDNLREDVCAIFFPSQP